jgi:delta-aminolevulinic acid dehydratase/porphobilinogen synthase
MVKESFPSHPRNQTQSRVRSRVKNGCLELKRNFYSIRVIADWNQITAEIKSIPGTARF